MRVETWSLVRETFYRALESPPSERPGLLERLGGEPEVRLEVERLLALHAETSDRLGEPGALLRAALPAPGTRIGRYTLQRVLGTGGMGTVFEALQDEPRRAVALKILHLGLASPARLQRFRFEAEVLGNLRHPSIAQIYEAGTHEESGSLFPFFAMELVAGGRDVLAHARERNLSLESRVRLFLEVCAAVHHGHQKGVIHRDLKAANILVDAEGRPKVIDFGVARAVEGERVETTTQAGQLVGTLSTMSPEQLAGRVDEIDARTDVYSLGVVLYELLTGRPPYELGGLSLEGALKRIRETEPPRAAGVPRELHWVMLRALEKDPARRYASASELAADLRRFLAHEAVLAGPPSARYRLAKFARRHRLFLSATSAVVLVLAVALVRESANARSEARARADAEREASRARIVSDFLERTLRSAAPRRKGREARVADALDEAARSVESVAGSDPYLSAALQKTIGAGYDALSLYQEAEPFLEASWRFAEQDLDRDDPFAAEIAASWANHLFWSSRQGEAETISREWLAHAEERFGPESEVAIRLRGTLASSLTELDRLDEAAVLLHRNLELVRKTKGERDESSIDILFNLSFLEMMRGHGSNLEPAMSYAEEALALCKELFPEDHFLTQEIRMLIAKVLFRSKKIDEAAEIYAASIDWCRAHLGDDSEGTLSAVTGLGGVLYMKGDASGSLAQFEEARRISDKLYGAATRSGISQRVDVSLSLLKLERAAEAEAAVREALELASGVLPQDHPTLLRARASLARSLIMQDRPEEAESMLRELVRDAESRFGPSDELVVSDLALLAKALSMQGKKEELEEVVRELERRVSPEDRFLARARSLLEQDQQGK